MIDEGEENREKRTCFPRALPDALERRTRTVGVCERATVQRHACDRRRGRVFVRHRLALINEVHSEPTKNEFARVHTTSCRIGVHAQCTISTDRGWRRAKDCGMVIRDRFPRACSSIVSISKGRRARDVTRAHRRSRTCDAVTRDCQFCRHSRESAAASRHSRHEVPEREVLVHLSNPQRLDLARTAGLRTRAESVRSFCFAQAVHSTSELTAATVSSKPFGG